MLIADPCILVANVPGMDSRLRSLLPGEELCFVRNLEDAKRTLQDRPVRMIIIGVRFAESTMFDLLVHVRSQLKYRTVPVVCVQGTQVPRSEIVRHGIGIAVKLLGADAFLDLTSDGRNDEHHRQTLRHLLTKHP
jgi:hypothetical protein